MNQKKSYKLFRHGVNLLKVNATLSGINKNSYQRVSLLVDTGSSFTIFPRSILEYLGYDLNNPIRCQSITTGQGLTSPLPFIQVAWFNCLGQLLNNFEVIAYDIPTNLQVNGLLGMDFLTRCKAVISLTSREIYFE
jgi:aspartyl protease family protein